MWSEFAASGINLSEGQFGFWQPPKLPKSFSWESSLAGSDVC